MARGRGGGAGAGPLRGGRGRPARARMAVVPDVTAIAQYGLVVSAWSRQDPEAFRARATSFVDRYPGHPAAPALLYALVATAADQGQVDQASAWTRRLLRLEPPSEYAGDALGRLAGVTRGRPEVLGDAYRDLLAHKAPGPQRADAWLGLGGRPRWRPGISARRSEPPRPSCRKPPGSPDARRPAPAPPRVPGAGSAWPGSRGRRVAPGPVPGRSRRAGHPAPPGADPHRGATVGRGPGGPADRARSGRPDGGSSGPVLAGEALRARGDVEAAIAAYLGATYLYPEVAVGGPRAPGGGPGLREPADAARGGHPAPEAGRPVRGRARPRPVGADGPCAARSRGGGSGGREGGLGPTLSRVEGPLG